MTVIDDATRGALTALIDRGELHGCVNLSEFDELVQALDRDTPESAEPRARVACGAAAGACCALPVPAVRIAMAMATAATRCARAADVFRVSVM